MLDPGLGDDVYIPYLFPWYGTGVVPSAIGCEVLFQAGEESVTLDLLPLILAIANEGRLEEEMFLTSFLWEEAKHTDFFSRFLAEVAGVTDDLVRIAVGCEDYDDLERDFEQAFEKAMTGEAAGV